MQWYWILFLGILGASLGSFVGAQVWRFRASHLDEDRKLGEEYDKSELKKLKPLLGKSIKQDRSRCLSCGHELRWYDLLPLVSWLTLRGKCRYCRQPIGWTEFLLEVGMAALFVLFAIFWPGSLNEPLEVVKLSIWMLALVPLAINFVYDMRWMVLISYCNWAIIGLGALYALIVIVQSGDWVASLLSVASSVLILGGIYGLLWLVSRGRWIGDGDIYLGAGLGLLLADWKLALLGLFFANLIGTAIVLPGILAGKISRKTQTPFGPLLIAGALLSWFVGEGLISWYVSLLGL